MLETEDRVLTLSEFYAHIKPLGGPIRTFNCGFNYLENWLASEAENIKHGVDIQPIFQREHTWTKDQQVKYLENVLRRVCDDSSMTIRFNCPSWREEMDKNSNLLDQMVCLDGMQRLTAIRKFIAGELEVFGLKFQSLPRRVLLRQLTIIIKMYDFQTKAEIYDFYLDINEGGTPHTKEQLDRVRNLPRD